MGCIKRLLLLSLSVLSLSSPSLARDIIALNSPLSDGQTLVSSSGNFELGFFSNFGNTSRYVGIWYNKISVNTVVWVANRERPLAGRNGTLSITDNGTLVIKDENSMAVVWSAIPYGAGLSDPVAQLLDTGNLVTKEAGDDVPSEVNYDSFAWQSFQHPTDTYIQNMKLGWNRRTGFANLTSWSSAGDPSPGKYSMFLDNQGYPQLTLWNGSTMYFRTGPSTGVQNGDSQVDRIIPDVTVTPDEIYFMMQPRDPSDIIRVFLGENGIIQAFKWAEQNKNWSLFEYRPKDPCDAASPCGPNGVCNQNGLVVCDCPPGFQPKNPMSWTLLMDNSEGCVRKTALDCQNDDEMSTSTDGFTTLKEMRVPDSEGVVADMRVTLQQCKAKCLSNCSCVAYASSNLSSGIGCFMWMTEFKGLRLYNKVGQDFYLRLAATDLANTLSPPKDSHKRKIMIVALSLASGMIAFTSAVFLIIRSILIRRTKGTSDSREYKAEKDEDVQLPLIDLATILVATDNFSDDKILGEGGFGIVYKGILADGKEIAIKRLSKNSSQGNDEFKNEVALISKLQHRNLVRLLCCCMEGDERLLVYEYMPFKSLDAILFAKDEAVHMSWKVRKDIINGVARGLLYLHQDSQLKIIHRDLKTSNILLDKDMTPKISDFGLARIFRDDISNVRTQRVVGTHGYMSPEYAMDGIFSVKSDIFSFGVLMLEIISGKRNESFFFNERENYLLGHAWNLWKEGRSLELVDPTTLSNDFATSEVMTCIKVGLLCVQEFPQDRPKMPSVIMMLASDDTNILPEPKQPGFIAARSREEASFYDNSEDRHSLTDFTLSSTLDR